MTSSLSIGCWLMGVAQLPTMALAEAVNFADPAAVKSLPVSGVSSISYVTLALAMVLGLVYAAAWGVRRLKNFSRGAQQSLDVIEALSLGPKERAVLLRVKDRQVLVGVSPGRVSLLLDLGSNTDATTTQVKVTPPVDVAIPSNITPPSFKSLLKRNLWRSMGLE